MFQTKLQPKIKQLPHRAGVYLYYNSDDEVIYIGKARVLSSRVRQYFQAKYQDLKTKALVKDIVDLSWIETETELDALLLESELVKRYQPRYNILLRDDKSQIFIKISSHKSIPEITTTRNPVDDGADYFGPYYTASSIQQALRLLRRVFPFFTRPYQPSQRPTLDRDIGLEPDVSSEEGLSQYRQDLQQIKRYLRGERRALINDLKIDMKQAAASQQFERAAELRNQINSLEELAQRVYLRDQQSPIQNDPGLVELWELLGLAELPRRIEGFDISHMGGTNVVASMVVFTNGISDRVEYRRFKIKIDKNDDYRNMTEVIRRRLRLENLAKWGRPDLLLIDGGKGQLSAALDVISQTGRPIAVIALAEQHEEIVVDLERSGVSLNQAKIEQLGGGVLLSHQLATIILPSNSHARKLLERVRNESHRFAVAYHSLLRKKQQTASALDNMVGIGPKTKHKLLHHFKAVTKIFQASEAELVSVVGRQKARIISQFKPTTSDKSLKK